MKPYMFDILLFRMQIIHLVIFFVR